MAYDIYGDRLMRGYCKVHPDVAEEYPCFFCMEDRQQDERQPRQDHCDDEFQEWEEAMAREAEEDRMLAESENGRNIWEAND